MNNYTKSKNKNTTNEYRHFLESNFVGVNRLFVLIYSNQDDNAKRFKSKKIYLPKGIVNNYNVIINKKLLWPTQWFWYKKIWRNKKMLTTGKCEVYTIGCLLDYEYIKNYYRLIAVDLSRQKELDADSKAL